MRKAVFILFFIFAVCGSAYAHPPSAINISYDPDAKTLRVFIVHNVSNPEKHYIKQVFVKRNGQEFALQYFSRQENSTGQSASFLVKDVKPGDVLSIQAFCSITGSLEKEIKILS